MWMLRQQCLEGLSPLCRKSNASQLPCESQYLFDSTMEISVLHCGHTIHLECLNEMRLRHRFLCPVCSRSACDMSNMQQKLDQVVAATPVTEFYQKNGMDHVQQLQGNVERALPRPGTEVPEFHPLQHQGDMGPPGFGGSVLQRQRALQGDGTHYLQVGYYDMLNCLHPDLSKLVS